MLCNYSLDVMYMYWLYKSDLVFLESRSEIFSAPDTTFYSHECVANDLFPTAVFPTCQLGICIFIGHAVTHAALPWPVTASARVQCHSSACEICGGQSGTGTGFLSSTSGFPVCIILPMLCSHSFIFNPRCVSLATESIVKF